MAVHCTNYIETYKCTVWEKYGAFVLNLWVQILTTTTEKVNEGRRRVLKCLLWCMWVSHKGQHVCVTMNRMCVSHKEQQVCESQKFTTNSMWVTTNKCVSATSSMCMSHREQCVGVWGTTGSMCVSHNEQQYSKPHAACHLHITFKYRPSIITPKTLCRPTAAMTENNEITAVHSSRRV